MGTKRMEFLVHTAVPAALAALLFINSLGGGFVYDDSRAILGNPDLLPGSPWDSLWTHDFWGTPIGHSGSHKSFRPLTTLTFRLNVLSYGLTPFSFHFSNLFLHVVSTVLFSKVANLLLRGSFPRFFSTLLFAAHPIHTEAVAGIVGRADVLSAALALSAFLSYAAHVKLRTARLRRQYLTNNNNETSTSSNFKNGFKLGPNGGKYLNNYATCKQQPKLGRRRNRNYNNNNNCQNCNSQRNSLTPDSSGGEDKRRKNVLKSSYKIESGKETGLLILALFFSALATFAKETGITILGVLAAYDVVMSLVRTVEYKRKFPQSLFSNILRNSAARSVGIVIGAGVCLLFLRLAAVGGFHLPTFAKADNPTAKEPAFLTRFNTFTYLPPFNFLLFIFPAQLSFDWGMEAIPRIHSVCDYRNLISLAFYGLLGKKLLSALYSIYAASFSQDDFPGERRKRKMRNFERNNNYYSKKMSTKNKFVLPWSHGRRNGLHNCNYDTSNEHQNVKWLEGEGAIVVSLAFLICPFLPATNVFFYVGFVVAERVLYLPSVGFSLLVGQGIGNLLSRIKKIKSNRNETKIRRLFLCSCFLSLAFLSFKTLLRNVEWRDEESLYRAGIPVNPPKSYGNLGTILSNSGRIKEAEEAYRTALAYRPNMADVHYNLGLLVEGQGRLEEALACYRSAIHFRPRLVAAYVSEGHVLSRLGRKKEAMESLERVLPLRDDGVKDLRAHVEAKVSALLRYGNLLAEREGHAAAISIFRKALSLMPPNYPQPESLYVSLGEAYFHVGDFSLAETYFQEALRFKPDHIPTYLTYGSLLATNKTRVMEAEMWFRRAKKVAPRDSAVYYQYGKFLSVQGRYEEAAAEMSTAASLSSSDSEILAEAAAALRRVGENDAAEALSPPGRNCKRKKG